MLLFLHGKITPPFSAGVCASVRRLTRFGAFTRVAFDNAAELKMGRGDMLTVIRNLTMNDFYKSMTTYNNHQIWQDVYRPVHLGIMLYVKLTLVESDNLLVVSF